MSAVDGTLFYSGYSGVTPIHVANLLKRTLSDDEKALVVDIISSVEDEFARQCNRNFDNDRTYYQYFDNGFTKVYLLNTPINTLTAIVVDGMDRTSNYTENTHYCIYDSYIRFLEYVSGVSLFKAIRLEYTIKKFWGNDVKQLITKWAAYDFLNSDNAGVGLSSMSFEQISQTFNTDQFIKERKTVIGRYLKANV